MCLAQISTENTVVSWCGLGSTGEFGGERDTNFLCQVNTGRLASSPSSGWHCPEWRGESECSVIWKSSIRKAKRRATWAIFKTKKGLQNEGVNTGRQADVDSYVCGTCLGHKKEAKTVHITSSSLNIFNWKPNSHASVKVTGGGVDRRNNLVMIYLTNVLLPREAR